MKEIPKSLIKKNNLDIRLSWEIKIQSFMSHPNLIKLYGYFSEGQNIYLIQEFAEGGNLFDLLKKNKTGLSEKTVSRHMREVCSAVLYMHDLQVAHRDIKPENVVICNVNSLRDVGCCQAVRFRLVNPYRRKTIDILWNLRLHVSRNALRQIIRWIDWSLVVGSPNIRAAHRKAAILQHQPEGNHQEYHQRKYLFWIR